MTIHTGKPVMHHLGFVVKDADEMANTYTNLLGAEFRLMPPYMVHSMAGEEAELRVYYGAIAGSIAEIIQPVRGDTPHQQWLDERGEGVQHLGLYVDDVVSATKDLLEKGGEIRWVYPNAGVVQLNFDSSMDEILGETLPGSLTYLHAAGGGPILELLGPPIHQGVVGGAVAGLNDYWETTSRRWSRSTRGRPGPSDPAPGELRWSRPRSAGVSLGPWALPAGLPGVSTPASAHFPPAQLKRSASSVSEKRCRLRRPTSAC